MISEFTKVRKSLSGKTSDFGGRGPASILEARFFQQLSDIMQEFPFGPANLYSSSNLDVFSFGSNPSESFALFSDHSGFVRLNRIVESGQKQNVFKRCLERTKEFKVKDETFSQFSRVFGLASASSSPSSSRHLVALKYWEGVSVVGLKEGGEESEFVSRVDVTGRSVADVAFANALNTYVVVDSTGSVTMVNYEPDKVVGSWTNALASQVRFVCFAKIC